MLQRAARQLPTVRLKFGICYAHSNPEVTSTWASRFFPSSSPRFFQKSFRLRPAKAHLGGEACVLQAYVAVRGKVRKIFLNRAVQATLHLQKDKKDLRRS